MKYTGNADGTGRHIHLLPETAGRIGGVSPVLLPEEFQRVDGWVAGCEVVPGVEVPGGLGGHGPTGGVEVQEPSGAAVAGAGATRLIGPSPTVREAVDLCTGV